jgi:thymidylate kinase
VILLLQTVWTGRLRDRYRDRLIALAAGCQDTASLRAELVRAFGPIGASLVDVASLSQATGDDWLGKLRRSMIRKTLLTPSRALKTFRHFLTDARRLLARLRRPPGVIVKVFAPSEATFAHFRVALQGFEFLFPMNKTSIQVVSGQSVPWRTRWQNAVESRRCLFKGGMDLQFYPVAPDADLSALIAQHSNHGRWRPARTFICLVDESGRGQLAHVGSGLMVSLSPSEMRTDEQFTPRLVRFVCSMLDRPRASKSASRRGLFCVLVGLDGAGKTTLARNLAIFSTTNPRPRFRGVRYYHWLPRPWKPVELPFPNCQDVPRKPKYSASPVHVALSCVRLLRNLLWAHLSYALILRRLRRRNYLVLLDRYFYNYILDPSSLKYSAPTWLLNGALPLFPKPDAVILLKADPSVLQSRKRELPPDEIAAQIARLDKIKLHGPKCIILDASRPADQVASAAFTSIMETASDHGAT